MAAGVARTPQPTAPRLIEKSPYKPFLVPVATTGPPPRSELTGLPPEDEAVHFAAGIATKWSSSTSTSGRTSSWVLR
jgi:hypothetical protein